MRRLLALVVFGVALGFGGVAAYRLFGAREPRVPDGPAVITQLREVAQLETLEVALYRKITFSPDPPASHGLWDDVVNWARYAMRTPQGRAIVFAVARVGVDLDQLGPQNVRLHGRTAYLKVPPMRVTVELKPGETEIIGSNLDSKETAQLFDLAKQAFERETAQDTRLMDRARQSTQRAIRALLLTVGFTQVHFVDTLPTLPGA